MRVLSAGMDSSVHQVCPICQSKSELKWKDHIGYQSSKYYDIYHCPDCYTAFSSPLEVDQAVYDNIYANVTKVPGYERYHRFAEQVLKEKDPLHYLAESEDVYWSVEKCLSALEARSAKVLEVGCGFGYLTYALNQAGFDVLGIDISQVAIENATRRYGPYYRCVDLKALPAEAKFDGVIFTEVIEHIEDAYEFLKRASQVLKSNGSIVLTTPNRTPYPEDVLWETEPPPIHLYWFSEKSICILAQKLGMAASFMDFTEFNLMEFDRTKTFHQPDSRVRGFKPSRSPRLDEYGKPIMEIKSERENEVIVSPPRNTLKGYLKKGLIFSGLYKFWTAWKAHLEKRRLDRLRQSIINNPKKRPTMCAVLRFNGKE